MTEEPQPGLSAREAAAEYAAGTDFDITKCAREPIHLLGSVQSHGALLALAEPGLAVAVASSNTAAMLGVDPETLLGLPVADILGADQARQLGEAASDEDGATAIVPVRLEESAAEYQLEVSVHRGDGLVICEFEPPADEPFRFSSFYPGVRRALLQLEGTQTVTALCQAAVRQVRALRCSWAGPGRPTAWARNSAIWPTWRATAPASCSCRSVPAATCWPGSAGRPRARCAGRPIRSARSSPAAGGSG
jgi:PAS fold